MKDTLQDRQAVRELVERWSVSRDAADWDTFRTLWHDDATITTLWYQGPWQGYLERSREGWGRGMSSVHYLCGSTVDVNGDRALSVANMVVFGRGSMDGAAYDLEVIAQFHDLVERRAGRWALAERCVVHVKDRMDPAEHGSQLALDEATLAGLPSHYRHLAYVHTRAGRQVKRDMPGLEGPEADRWQDHARSWLAAGG